MLLDMSELYEFDAEKAISFLIDVSENTFTFVTL